VLTVRKQEYVLASKAIGVKDQRIIARHILPNIIAAILIYSSLRVATVILTAASLSFLGLGVQPPTPEWGSMIAETRKYARVAPHVIVFPGIAITVVILGLNLLGDGLRDFLDPTLKN
jgi:peptide/nickel transport system permease protein